MAVAGLAVTAVAGFSAQVIHAPGAAPASQARAAAAAVQGPQVVRVQLASAVSGARVAFRGWWVHGGYRQYQAVARDLSQLVITDSLQDNDPSFHADAQKLVTDATRAGRHLPPAGRAAYRAGMKSLAQAGRDALAGSYDKAFTGVTVGVSHLAAFNHAISAWDTTVPTA